MFLKIVFSHFKFYKMRLLFLGCFLWSTFLFSQEKIEREYRIKSSQVPQKAIDFINQISFDSKLRWYAEENQNGKAIELKSCKNKRKYSIKFSVGGKLIDVEKRLKLKDLPKNHLKNIQKTLEKEFEKFSLEKIQIQWKATNKKVITHINNKITDFTDAVYEIIIKGKKKNTYRRYEVLIKKGGKIITILPLSRNNNDNLEF